MSSRVALAAGQYDATVKRKSLEDPHRQHRRSSIPFSEREPAVKFYRNVDQRKGSISGPYNPKAVDGAGKPILKQSAHPILVTGLDDAVVGSGGSGTLVSGTSNEFITTNDELEFCRYKADLIMDKISKAERKGRGGLDVLTFPTTGRRVEALSRFQGCMLIAISAISYYTKTDEYKKLRKSTGKARKISRTSSIYEVIDLVSNMYKDSKVMSSTAKKFHTKAVKIHEDWDKLVKRNTDFGSPTNQLHYPIYTHKKMPESITLFEDSLENEELELPQIGNVPMEGYMRLVRKQLDGSIYLFCDLAEDASLNEEDSVKVLEAHSFMDNTPDIQEEVIKYLILHVKKILSFGVVLLKEAVELLTEHDLDEGYKEIYNKLSHLEYDDMFDPYCAVEVKSSICELVARKAELLNTSEQIQVQAKWLVEFLRHFKTFAIQRIKGRSKCVGCLTCTRGGSKGDLLKLLASVQGEDVTVIVPLTLPIFQDVFNINPFQAKTPDEKGDEPPLDT